jgi:hypothetical protein
MVEGRDGQHESDPRLVEIAECLAISDQLRGDGAHVEADELTAFAYRLAQAAADDGPDPLARDRRPRGSPRSTGPVVAPQVMMSTHLDPRPAPPRSVTSSPRLSAPGPVVDDARRRSPRSDLHRRADPGAELTQRDKQRVGVADPDVVQRVGVTVAEHRPVDGAGAIPLAPGSVSDTGTTVDETETPMTHAPPPAPTWPRRVDSTRPDLFRRRS